MKSAGDYNSPAQGPGPQGPAAPPTALWTPPDWQNFYNASSGMNINATTTLDKDQVDRLFRRQHILNSVGMGIAGLGTLANTIVGGILAHGQLEVMKDYYKTEATMRKYDMKVAIRGMESQDHLVDAQLQGMRSQQTHEQAMARIQQRTQVAITRIQEKGKTARAEVLASSQAFSLGRNDWNYGIPSYSMS